MLFCICYIELQVSYEGECFAIDKCPNPPSPTNFELVCGSDGVNYPSDQAFICAKLKEMSNDIALTL
jgi:Kazal-type serine protease inhibitor domain